MVTVEIPAKLTIDDLVVAVEQLPTPELTKFVRRIIAIQAQRGAPLLVSEEEQVLLEIVTGKLPAQTQKRLDMLRRKSRTASLTPAEQAELLGFVQQVERQDLARVEALVNLARRRGVTVSTLMRKLGLEPILFK
jgi:transposase